MKFNPNKLIIPGAVLGVLLILLFMTAGVNDAGQRTVIQYPSGTLKVQFDPGVYFSFFGKTTEYNDFITFDHDRSASDDRKVILDQTGIGVRYRDGGMGATYGKERFALPNDAETMISLHKAFRSNRGVANKLIKPITEEAMNLTAGFITSEEAYDTKRAIFTELVKAQIQKGKFKTKIEKTTVTDITTGKSIEKEVPVILEIGGIRQHIASDLVQYGVTLASIQLNDPGFEPKTKDQIAKKRAATMDIITSKAEAEKSKQDAITAEEKGKAAVVTAKYAKEVIKMEAVVEAEQKKEVAVIAAAQKVDVAVQSKLEAVQFKLKAAEIKAANILEGEGLAEKKRLIIEADGALEQKLKTYERVNGYYAEAIGKNKLVPEVVMGGSTEGAGTVATNLINMLTAKTAKELALDMSMDSAKN